MNSQGEPTEKTATPKSAGRGMLPFPESKGAILFKETCSQCHALSDPALHTAQEWRAVVERMRGDMRTMGREIVTEEEKKEIVSYLSDLARK